MNFGRRSRNSNELFHITLLRRAIEPFSEDGAGVASFTVPLYESSAAK